MVCWVIDLKLCKSCIIGFYFFLCFNFLSSPPYYWLSEELSMVKIHGRASIRGGMSSWGSFPSLWVIGEELGFVMIYGVGSCCCMSNFLSCFPLLWTERFWLSYKGFLKFDVCEWCPGLELGLARDTLEAIDIFISYRKMRYFEM